MIGFAWKYFDQGSVSTVKDLVSPGWYASRLGCCGVDVKMLADFEISTLVSSGGVGVTMCADSEISTLLSSAGPVVMPVGLQADEPTTKAVKIKSLNFMILESIETLSDQQNKVSQCLPCLFKIQCLCVPLV